MGMGVGRGAGRGGGGGFGPPRSFGQNNFNQPSQNPYNQPSFGNDGARTPAPGKTPAYGGRTPMHPPSDSRTPAWNVSRTPNPYAGGGRTPAWTAGSATPAWGASRTPNPYADGGRTPGWGAGANSSSTQGYGYSPTHHANNGWDYGGSQTPGHNPDRQDNGWNPVSFCTFFIVASQNANEEMIDKR